MPMAGFEPTIPTSVWPQTQALGRAATVIGIFVTYYCIIRNLVIYAGFLKSLRCYVKSLRLGYASYVSRNCEIQREVNILVGKLHLKDKGKTWEDNIQMDHGEVVWN
jgi:hypothetical protein